MMGNCSIYLHLALFLSVFFVALGSANAEDDQEYYVDDGCQSERGKTPKDDVIGRFQPKSSKAHVRCCLMDGSECSTPGSCKKDDQVTFDEAADHCGEIDATTLWRLCTKDELLSEICCQTGGLCDNFAVWTSTPKPKPEICQFVDGYIEGLAEGLIRWVGYADSEKACAKMAQEKYPAAIGATFWRTSKKINPNRRDECRAALRSQNSQDIKIFDGLDYSSCFFD